MKKYDLEQLQKDQMLDYFLVSIVSSESLTSANDCKQAITTIDSLLDVLPNSKIKQKEFYQAMLENSKSIVKKNLSYFI